MEKEAVVFIDGAYFSLISKHFGSGKHLNVDIRKFAENISRTQGLICKKIYYYISPPFQTENPSKEEIRRKRGYDKFSTQLEKQGIILREGRCQKIHNEYSQKGVDTLITIDLIRNAEKHNNLILVTSDTDFVPAIEDVIRNNKVHVTIFFFNDFVRGSRFSMSDHILDVCNKRVLLKRKDFLESLIKKQDLQNRRGYPKNF
jgi:uncharacterized LabA/DUF88 family protein